MLTSKKYSKEYPYISFLSRCIICCIYICFSSAVTAQYKILDWSEYFKMIGKADSLYEKGNYKEALDQYLLAFRFNSEGWSEGHKYRVARAWSRTGNKDSAFFALHQEVETGYRKTKELQKEPAFKHLHHEKEWKLLIEAVRYTEQKFGKYNKIRDRLEGVFILDQKYRKSYQAIIDSFGYDSPEKYRLEKKMKEVDAKNLKYVSRLIDSYGWISRDSIGSEGSTTIFLVIQHADSATQEKYLPLLREAVKQKKASASQLALLEDRVLLKRGLKQIYGSQLYWEPVTKKWALSPIENEAEVDKRRAEMGLQPLKDYLKYFKIDY